MNLISMQKEVQKPCTVHTLPNKFENAALFLRLGLPTTLIRHENGVFPAKALFKPEEFEHAVFAF